MAIIIRNKSTILGLSADLLALQAANALEASARAAADTTLTNNLAGEVTRATGAETTLTNGLAAEVSRATAAEGVLTADLASEVSRASGVEGVLGDLTTAVKTNLVAAINSEKSRAMFAESTLTSNLGALQTYVDTTVNEAITDLTAAIATEAADRATAVTAEENLRIAAVNAEETARIAADTLLQGQINNIVSNVDPVALDSLTEIVAAFRDMDGDLAASIAALGTQSQSAITAEETRAMAAETAIADDLAAEVSDRQAAITTVTSALTAETTRASAAEGVLTTDLASEVSRATAAEGVLTTNLAGEVTRATAAEGTLTTNLAGEVTRATNAEAAIATDLATEVSDRTDADAALQTALDDEIAARKANTSLPVMESRIVTSGKIVLTDKPQGGINGVLNFATVRWFDSANSGVAYDAQIIEDTTDTTGKTFTILLDAEDWNGNSVFVQYLKAIAV